MAKTSKIAVSSIVAFSMIVAAAPSQQVHAATNVDQLMADVQTAVETI